MLYLFWDIDGTLLLTARAGVFALEEAAEEAIGTPVDLSTMKTAGMTDAEIAVAIVDTYGDGDPKTAGHLLRRYERARCPPRCRAARAACCRTCARTSRRCPSATTWSTCC